MIKNSRTVFKDIFDSIQVEDWNKPMTWEDLDSELCVYNPYSKITCLILYLYSMELGTPPLYAETNRVARDMDLTHLENLGPFIQALGSITKGAEGHRKEDDRIKFGQMVARGFERNMAGALLLWRGAPMKQEWIQPYIDSVGKDIVCLPGNTSCSRDPRVALKFALGTVKPDHTATLFIFCCQNNYYPLGVLMNHEAYTAYPSEGEMLLMEGCAVYVLAVEDGVRIHNKSETMKDYDGKSVTVVHLFHRC